MSEKSIFRCYLTDENDKQVKFFDAVDFGANRRNLSSTFFHGFVDEAQCTGDVGGWSWIGEKCYCRREASIFA